MTPEQIENSKLIAQFMGYEYIPHDNAEGKKPGWWVKGLPQRDTKLSNHLCRSHNELPYLYSIDDCQPVLKKLIKDYEAFVTISTDGICCASIRVSSKLAYFASWNESMRIAIFNAISDTIKYLRHEQDH